MFYVVLLLQLAASSAIGVGCARPGLPRRRAATGLAIGATILILAAAAVAVSQGFATTRSLELVHRFQAILDGVDVGQKDFPIGVRTAPASIWLVLAGCFLGCWAAILFVAKRQSLPAFVTLLGWAWSALALQFALELAAAPRDVVHPFAFDRALYPIALTSAVMLAEQRHGVVAALFSQVLLVELSRLPLVVLGILASHGSWCLSVDVHATTRFVNPFSRQEMFVEPLSYEQLGWLVVAPHGILLPSFYVLSTGGLLYCISMFRRYGTPKAAAAS